MVDVECCTFCYQPSDPNLCARKGWPLPAMHPGVVLSAEFRRSGGIQCVHSRYTLFRAGYNKGRVVRAIELTRGVHHSATCFSNDDGGCCQVPAVKAKLVIGISSTRGQVAECQSGAPNDADPGSEGRMWVSGRGHALTWRAQGVSPSVPHLLVGTLHTQK